MSIETNSITGELNGTRLIGGLTRSRSATPRPRWLPQWAKRPKNSFQVLSVSGPGPLSPLMKCSVQTLTHSPTILAPLLPLWPSPPPPFLSIRRPEKKKSLGDLPRDRILMLLLLRRPTVIQNRVFSLRWSESAGPTETPLCHLCLTDERFRHRGAYALVVR